MQAKPWQALLLCCHSWWWGQAWNNARTVASSHLRRLLKGISLLRVLTKRHHTMVQICWLYHLTVWLKINLSTLHPPSRSHSPPKPDLPKNTNNSPTPTYPTLSTPVATMKAARLPYSISKCKKTDTHCRIQTWHMKQRKKATTIGCLTCLSETRKRNNHRIKVALCSNHPRPHRCTHHRLTQGQPKEALFTYERLFICF